MRKAVINELDIVENVIEADDSFSLPGKRIIDAGSAGPGWFYKNGKLIPPVLSDPAPEEFEPSDLEVRLAALEEKAGITQADKDAARISLKDNS